MLTWCLRSQLEVKAPDIYFQFAIEPSLHIFERRGVNERHNDNFK